MFKISVYIYYRRLMSMSMKFSYEFEVDIFVLIKRGMVLYIWWFKIWRCIYILGNLNYIWLSFIILNIDFIKFEIK